MASKTYSQAIEKLRANPVATAICIVAFYVIWFCLPALLNDTELSDGGLDKDPDLVGQLLPEIGLVASILVFVALLGSWREMRITTKLEKNWYWVMIPPVLYIGLFFAIGLIALSESGVGWSGIPLQIFGPLILTTFLVGIFEEFLFRGVVFHAFEKWRGPILAAFISSIMFGAMHYVNWVGGQQLSGTHVQVMHAGAAGILYAGIILKTGSIWPAVLAHGAWDLTVTFTQVARSYLEPASTVEAVSSSFVQAAILGFEPVYGLILIYLWWRSKNRSSAKN